MSEIYVLVRADDIGMEHGVNEACIHAFRAGIARSVELMAPCPWFAEAARMLAECPDYDVGVHLTLTSEWDNLKWGPMTAAPSLVMESGYFCQTFWPREGVEVFRDLDWKIEEVEQELRAQIEKVLKHAPHASHLSGHMGLRRVDERIGAVYERLEAEYGLVVDVGAFARFAGFGAESRELTPEEKTEALRANLTDLGPGKWLFIDHPAFDAAEIQALGHPGYGGVALDRAGVTRAWTDAQVQAIIHQRGIQLVSYADVEKGLA
ncbi:MAG: ChbG/HpnK family deacetylase [Candidatus Latescibacterota bacterium]|nr:ChbG/HpnK family deacetylase [Candidatus Latescibacterota bacterium]